MVSTPGSLKDLCLRYCVVHPKLTLMEDVYESEDEMEIMGTDGHSPCLENHDVIQENRDQILQFRKGVFLPEEVFESMLHHILYYFSESKERYIKPFHDKTRCRLRRIDLSQLSIKDQNLITGLFVHPLTEVNLSGCLLNSETLGAMKICSTTLRNLNLSDARGNFWLGLGFSLLSHLKYLQRLDLSNTEFGKGVNDVDAVAQLEHLRWLDLSGTKVQYIRPLGKLGNTLAWLSLYNCPFLEDTSDLIVTLLELTVLAHLDLSKDISQQVTQNDNAVVMFMKAFPDVNSQLLQAVASLPVLNSLDISGSHNLAGGYLMPFYPPRTKMKFLGLLRTGLCYHVGVPAEMVTGEAGEAQIYAALEVYSKRMLYVLSSLRDLFNITSSQLCQNSSRAIELIISSMKNHCGYHGIQIAGSASLYHLSRGDSVKDPEIRRSIVTAVLDAMETHPEVLQLQKNCCLTLCNFHIPDEVEFQYIRMTDILLKALKAQTDNYLRRIAIMLFNAIVCHNSGVQKLAVGKKGSIKIIVDIIREIVNSGDTETLLETCWSSLWNVTDETPDNCSDFIACGGMDLFLRCLRQFPDKPEIQRNMMGLLGNVAEVAELRPVLIKGDYLKIFYELLDTTTYELEVSYNAGGVLAHLASDGPKEWDTEVTRESCMMRLMQSVEEWDIRSYRNINYRSFEPILRLLEFFETPAIQRWATWALANLTQVYPERYCKLLSDENGVSKLEMVARKCSDDYSVELASRTILRVVNYLSRDKQT